MHLKKHKVRSFDVPWKQINRQFQPLLAMHTLPTVGSKKIYLYPVSLAIGIFKVTSMEQ
jgi:hypothetical protein